MNPLVFANATTVVGLGLYVVCRVLALVAPDLLFAVGQSWFHTLNLSAVKAASPLDIGTFIFGGITLGALVWVTSYVAATLYKNWVK